MADSMNEKLEFKNPTTNVVEKIGDWKDLARCDAFAANANSANDGSKKVDATAEKPMLAEDKAELKSLEYAAGGVYFGSIVGGANDIGKAQSSNSYERGLFTSAGIGVAEAVLTYKLRDEYPQIAKLFRPNFIESFAEGFAGGVGGLSVKQRALAVGGAFIVGRAINAAEIVYEDWKSK